MLCCLLFVLCLLVLFTLVISCLQVGLSTVSPQTTIPQTTIPQTTIPQPTKRPGQAVQEEGEFVVTFPGAHHAGFSYGMGCSESVCVAPPDWLRVAGAAAARCRVFCRPMSLPQDAMVLAVGDTMLLRLFCP